MLYFLIISVVIIALTLIIKNTNAGKVLSSLYLVNLLVFVWHAFSSKGTTELAYFTYDSTALILLGILAVIAVPAFYHSFIYLKTESDRGIPLYVAALTALLTSLVGVYLSNNLIVLWIFMEATTLTVSALIYHHRSAHALEATWKYVFVSSVGIALAYMGILFMGAIVSPSEEFSISFAALQKTVANADPAYLRVAFLFMLVGFSTKMELFPMHTVGIDANTIAPPPVSAVISTLMVNSGFVAIYRIVVILDGTAVGAWVSNVLILSGILSVIIAATYLLKSNNLKRLLAYSTLENMGLVAIALGIGGVARYAAFIHIIVHSFIKASLFFQSRQVYGVYHTYDLPKIGGYLRLYPAGALVVLLGAIGIVAFPPSGLFISELIIFKTLLVQGRWVVFVLLALALLFCIFAIVQKLLAMLYNKQPEKIAGEVPPRMLSLSQLVMIGIAFYLFFFQAGAVSNLINEAIK